MATNTSTNALELLTKDHRKVAGILERLTDTTKRATKARDELLAELKDELQIHEEIEESIFYPTIKENTKEKEVHELVAEAFQEHHVVDILIEELKATPTEDDTWKAKLTVLKENIEHHINEEEQQLFPKVKKIFNNKDLAALGEKMASMKEEQLA